MLKKDLESYKNDQMKSIKEQNRTLIANCNVWAEHLRKNVDPDNEFPQQLALLSQAVRVLGRTVSNVSEELKAAVAYDIAAGTAITMGITTVKASFRTPASIVEPFQEPGQYFTMAVMETVLSDVPTVDGMEPTDARDVITNFTQAWTNEDYDNPSNLMPLIYMTAYSRFHFSFLSDSRLLHVSKPVVVLPADSFKTLKVKHTKGTMCTSLYFKKDDKRALLLHLVVQPDIVRHDVAKNFDHTTYRTYMALQNQNKK